MSDTPEILGGRYELGRLLGHGGMAEVFLGTDTRLHRPVAVKVLRHDLARDDSFQERFRREAQSAAGLNHPAIVAVYDTGEEHQDDHRGREVTIPYIVMEYVEGRTLREFIREGHPMDTRQAGEIMAGVLSALEYSHHAGIVHRDIKPGNIMITDAGQVKVMDFGIARAVADATSAMTQTQAVMGTAQYLSPEQARGQLVDARSDIYSAACVLYELITSRPPFTGESPVSIAYQHVREEPVPPSTYNPQLSPAWDAVVLRGLAKDRDERYPSAVAFSRDIAAVVAGRPPLLAAGAATAASAGSADTGATTVLSPVPDEATTVLPAAGGALGASAPSGPQALASAGPATGTQTAVEEPPRKKRVWPIVLIVLAVLAIAAGVFAYFQLSDDGSGSVPVADVVGKTSAEAKQQLEAQGLRAKEVQAPDDTVAQDSVVSSDPTAGTEVPTGTEVTITVSTGPDAVPVPDLAGKTTDEAQQLLKDAGLEMKVAGTEKSKDVDRGQVTRSDPGAGTSAASGQTIQVWTSNGKVDVPDVKGQKQADAEKAIEAAGLTSTVTEKEGTADQVGTVLDQNPAAGEADKGSAVTIVVATAPGPVTIPNLTGATPDDATSQLRALGFGVTRQQENNATVPEGAVIRTEPGGNTQADAGSTVTIFISQGPAPTTPPATTAPPATTTPAPTPSPTPTEDDGAGDDG